MQRPPSAAFAGRWFPALAEPAVGRYLLGQLVSVNGTWVIDITINLLVWRLSASPALLGAVNFLLFGPMVVVAPLAGPRLRPDNARCATLVILGVSLAIALALAGLSASGGLGLAAISVLALLRGICSGLELPARQVLLAASMSDRSRIGNAVAMNTVVFNVGRMVGPAIAAALFAALDATWGFAIGAATLVVMIACVASMPPPAVPESPVAGSGTRGPGLREAIRYVRADRIASLFMPTCALVGVFAGSLQTIVPALADRFGGAAAWTGWLFGASGFGSLSAGILLSTRYMAPALRRLQISMPWVVALALFGIGLAPVPPVAMLWFCALGFAFTFCAAGFNGGLQQRAPVDLRGPLIGLYSMCFMGSLPLGHLLAGMLAQQFGVRRTLLVLGVLMTIGTVLVFAPRWLSLGRIELDSERI